jgi:predicted RNA-binding Zn ribbon-like protein
MAKTSKSLIDLIEIAATRHDGASGRRLAELAQRAGHDISHATLNRLRQGSYATRPSDASIRAIAYLADVSENVAFAAAGVSAPAAVVYQVPAEAQRMTTRQRKALDELIRAFAADDKPAPAAGLDFGRLLAARERLNTALTAGGERVAAARLVEAAREAVAGIDEVIDALFAAASDQDPADDESQPDFTGFTTDHPARAVG